MSEKAVNVGISPVREGHGTPQSSTIHPPESNTSPTKARQDNRGSLTSAISNPHDAALSQIFDQVRRLEEADLQQDPEGGLGIAQSNSPDSQQYSIIENLYDPSTGAVLGVFAPIEHEDTMWTQLAKIRDLQSEIATMHLQMEGVIGGSERPAKTKRQDSEDDAERDSDPRRTAEQQEKMAKEAEFARLEEKFEHKRQAIDALMDKLSTLSQSVKSFHSLRKPVLNLPSDDNFLNPSGSPGAAASPNSPPAPSNSTPSMPTVAEHQDS